MLSDCAAVRSVHYNDAWSIPRDGPGYTWTTDNPLAAKENQLIT
ncbi:hypothetical protein GCM10009744_00160 [Kribbella alba]|uniref:Uncharacterized protein n=1 Tax=Kribbella alba TaxID=190197 RepID=A0ABN2EV37_9ACTN